jgi:hypothetical protein
MLCAVLLFALASHFAWAQAPQPIETIMKSMLAASRTIHCRTSWQRAMRRSRRARIRRRLSACVCQNMKGRNLMKRVVASLAVGAILAALLPEGARPQATQGPPAAAAPAPPAAEKRAEPGATRGSWTRPDARVCLEFPTNLQVIKCAEKYRYARPPA